jgi:DNA-binding NtrC family response regulator
MIVSVENPDGEKGGATLLPYGEPAAAPTVDRKVAVLTVSPLRETHARLRGIFQSTKWSFQEACTCAEAISLLANEPRAVVVCEATLEEGDWKKLMAALRALPRPPKVIVTSCDADDALWTDVLNSGGYDVLPRPFDRSEVARIVSLAWLQWRTEGGEMRRNAASAGSGAALASA